MNKELFEGPVGDYCIARNTIKFLFSVNHIRILVVSEFGYFTGSKACIKHRSTAFFNNGQ